MEKTIKAKSYTLRNEHGGWLAQILISDDGAFCAISDYGNFNVAWRSFGNNFREFLTQINVDYFASKIYTANQYIVTGKKIEKYCQLFAEKILPAFQEILKSELAEGIEF